MKKNKLHQEKKELINQFRSNYFRRFGTVISVHETHEKPVVNPHDLNMEKLETIMLPFMELTIDPKKRLYSTFINDCRIREFVELRMIYMKILFNIGYNLSEIGRYMKKDHSTVLYNISTCDNLIESDEKFQKLYYRIVATVRLTLKYEKKHGKTITVLPIAPDHTEPDHALATRLHEHKTRKDRSKHERRSRATHKHGLSGYRVSHYAKGYKSVD